MFLEPTAEANAVAGAASSYSDPTTAWKRELYRMTGLNGSYATNWLTRAMASNNQAVEFMSATISGFSCIAQVRLNRGAQTGYAAFVQFNGSSTRLQIGLYRWDAGSLVSIGTSPDFVDGFTANWSQVYIEIKAVGTTISATARWDEKPTVVQATISVTDNHYASGDVGAACIIASTYLNQFAAYDPTSETLDKVPDTQWVAVGDSITVQSTDGVQYGYVAWAQGILGRKVKAVNRSVGGTTTTDLIADAANIDALYDAVTYKNNILSMLIGTNALLFITGAQEVANDWTYLDARRAVGWDRLFIPVMNRVIGPAYGVTQDWEDHYQAYLLLVAAQVASHSEGYADILAVPQIGGAGAENDTAVFTDGLHPSSIGMQYLTPPIAVELGVLRTLGLTAPTVSFITVSTSGDSITAILSKLDCSPGTGIGHFTLLGTAAVVNGWTIVEDVLVLSLTGTIKRNEEITVVYLSTGDNPIVDHSANLLADFSTLATNQSLIKPVGKVVAVVPIATTAAFNVGSEPFDRVVYVKIVCLVSLTSSEKGEILYTLDGSIPDDDHGTRYLKPVMLYPGQTLKAHTSGSLLPVTTVRCVSAIAVGSLKRV